MFRDLERRGVLEVQGREGLANQNLFGNTQHSWWYVQRSSLPEDGTSILDHEYQGTVDCMLDRDYHSTVDCNSAVPV